MKRTTLKTKIAEQISLEREYISEHEKIRSILNGVNGKDFSYRVLNKKVLNGLEFSSEYGMFHINGKFNHLIGYRGSCIDAEKFEEFDCCHGSAAKERIAKLESIDFEKMFKVFNKVEKCFNGLRSVFGEIDRENMGSFHNPAFYSILRDIQGYDDTSDKIRLSDFNYIKF